MASFVQELSNGGLVFYVDVRGINPADVPEYIDKIKEELKVGEDSGTFYFIPHRDIQVTAVINGRVVDFETNQPLEEVEDDS